MDDLWDKLGFRRFECFLGKGDWKIAREMIEAIKETTEHRAQQDVYVADKDAVSLKTKALMYHDLYNKYRQVHTLLTNLRGYLDKAKVAGTSGNCSDAAI